MKKLWRYSGILLVCTGILHTIAAVIMGKDALHEIIDNKVFNSIPDGSSSELAFWFLVCGLIIILFGQTLHHYLKITHKPAPSFIGYFLLIFSIAGCIIMPLSGFWLFIPQALIIITAPKRR